VLYATEGFPSEMKLRSWHSTKAAAGTWKSTVVACRHEVIRS
jgi:hypothetical protein